MNCGWLKTIDMARLVTSWLVTLSLVAQKSTEFGTYPIKAQGPKRQCLFTFTLVTRFTKDHHIRHHTIVFAQTGEHKGLSLKSRR